MNYIKEINAFNDYLLINKLSTGEIALWYALMHINNKTGWLKEFTVSNLVIQQLTSLSRAGLDNARNKLKQRGLIDYKPGRSNRAGKYKMFSLVCNIIDTVEDTAGDTVEDKDKTQQETDTSHSSSTLYKQKLKQKEERKKDGQNNSSSTYQKIIDNFTQDEKVKEAIWGYIQMRISKRAKPTDRALELIFKKLALMSAGDIQMQISILNQSVMNNWTDIYPLKDKGGVEHATTKDAGGENGKYSQLDKTKWLEG